MTDLSRSTPVSSIREIIGGDEPTLKSFEAICATALGFEYGRLKLVAKVAPTEEESSGSSPPDPTRQTVLSMLFNQTADSLMDGENSPIDSTAS